LSPLVFRQGLCTPRFLNQVILFENIFSTTTLAPSHSGQCEVGQGH
jgi:hypothetical protein